MTSLEKIAFHQNRHDEVPNQLLARELAETQNKAGIREIVEALADKNRNIRSDCLKVLYEIGYLDPSLIATYAKEFLALLVSKDNRMVWGAMIALATIADRRPDEIWAHIDDVIRATTNGTVITMVWGIRVLAKVAAADPIYKGKIFPILVDQVNTCIPRDVPTHTESILCAVDAGNKNELMAVLELRRSELTPPQLTRFKRVMKLLALI